MTSYLDPFQQPEFGKLFIDLMHCNFPHMIL